jgi:hypothetical protein
MILKILNYMNKYLIFNSFRYLSIKQSTLNQIKTGNTVNLNFTVRNQEYNLKCNTVPTSKNNSCKINCYSKSYFFMSHWIKRIKNIMHKKYSYNLD